YSLAPLAGDRWLLKLQAEWPAGNAYVARLVELVSAGDGMGDLLSGPLSPNDIIYIRVKHAEVLDAAKSAAGLSVAHADLMVKLATDTALPAVYRHSMAQRAHGIYVKALGSEDARLIPVVKVIAFTSHKTRKEEWFRKLLSLQEKKLGAQHKDLA